jgi:CheY-like chemotaxis protein
MCTDDQRRARRTDGSSPPRILVVDDDDGVRTVLRRLIERWGYACEEASSGRTALARLDAGTFSLVSTDYDMPDGNGLMLIRAVAARTGDGRGRTPIILVSGSATDDVCDAALTAGASGVLRKPFAPAFLEATITLLVGAPDAERSAQPAPPDQLSSTWA